MVDSRSSAASEFVYCHFNAGMPHMVSPRSLNFPTGCAFRGNKQNFEFYMLESGHDFPSPRDVGSGDFDPMNPCAPDILVSARIHGPHASANSEVVGRDIGVAIASRISHLGTSCLGENVFDSGEIETGGIRVRSPRSRLE